MKQDFGTSAEKDHVMVLYYSETVARQMGCLCAEVLSPDGVKRFVEYTEMTVAGLEPLKKQDDLREECRTPLSCIRVLTRPTENSVKAGAATVRRAQDMAADLYKLVR